MSNKVEIITDESGNKKSVVMPYALYEALINALAAHDESIDRLMELASLLVESQEIRREAKPSEPRLESQAIASPAPSRFGDSIGSTSPSKFGDSVSLGGPPKSGDSISDEEFSTPTPAKDPKQDIRSYQRARGWFTETGGFWVLAGSVARFIVSNAFEGVESLVTLRRKLVEDGTLGSDPNFPDYVFMRDCYFNSASIAACIIDGNARNNPSVWKKR